MSHPHKFPMSKACSKFSDHLRLLVEHRRVFRVEKINWTPEGSKIDDGTRQIFHKFSFTFQRISNLDGNCSSTCWTPFHLPFFLLSLINLAVRILIIFITFLCFLFRENFHTIDRHSDAQQANKSYS